MENNNTVEKKTTKATAKDLEIATLKEQLAQMQEALASLMNSQKVAPTVQPSVNIVTPNTDVVLVYCSDSLGHLATAHVDLNFTRWGEEFTMSRSQFDEVVGKYRSWFDRGILAVSGSTEEGIKIAANKGIRTDKEYYLDVKKLEGIGRMSTKQIEELWANTPLPKHQESIVTFVKRKFIENDPLYHNREKIDLFNRLTNGGFTREQDELSGRIKIQPTDMSKL